MSARILVVDDSPTIRKVVAGILKRRDYEALLVADGFEALQTLKEEKVDLVLLDFVMPRMNGYQLCRELRANESLKNLPVILMSAKGDKIRGQFVQQTGAIDAITKPFDARGLIAVVEGALKRSEEGRARPVPDAASIPEQDPEEDSGLSNRISWNDATSTRRLRASTEFGAAVAEALVPSLGHLGSKGEVARLIQQSISPQLIDRLAPILASLDFGEDQHEVLSGDISVISIAEILQLLHLQRQTGALSISSKKSEINLYVREGNVDFAMQRGLRDAFLIGSYLIASGSLTREQIDAVQAEAKQQGQLLGEALVERELVTENQIQRALTQQTSELLFEVVRWNQGRFRFITQAKHPAAEAARLGLATGALVMEGFRRVDEWQLIEGSFDFNDVLARDEVAIDSLGEGGKLTAKERAVLEAIDGQRTIGEVIDGMGGSSFELCKILYQFLNSRIVRRKAA